MNNLAIKLEGVSKTYRRGNEEVHALQNIDMTVGSGEFLAVAGPSGSGKTTLLNLIGCMDNPTDGRINIMGKDVSSLKDAALTQLRRKAAGFVFQQFYLIPTLTALENILVPSIFSKSNGNSRKRAHELLEIVGLQNRSKHFPSELSGGEMQRVAIARALINEPKILLADEPTGNLDSQNALHIAELLKKLNAQGLTIVMVTHNAELAAMAYRIVHLKDGRLNLEISAHSD